MRRRRAFTLLELIVVIVLMGILSTAATVTWQRFMTKTDESAQRSALESIASSMEAHYMTRGWFPDTAPELARIDASFSYVGGATESSGPTEMSVRVLDTNPDVVGVAVLSRTGRCVAIVSTDPDDDSGDRRWVWEPAVDEPCTADEAVGRGGGDVW